MKLLRILGIPLLIVIALQMLFLTDFGKTSNIKRRICISWCGVRVPFLMKW